MANAASAEQDIGPLHFVVCVDSTKEPAPFDAAALYTHAKGAKVTVFHAVVPEEADAEPEHVLRSFYEAKLVRYPKGTAALSMPLKPLTEAARHFLLGSVTKLGPDILVVGYTGRKGPRDDPSVCGSTTDLSVREGHTSALIVKRAPANLPGVEEPQVICVGVDGSARGYAGLAMAARLAAGVHRPPASIHCIYVDDASAASGHPDAVAVEAGVRKQLAELGVEGAGFTRVALNAATAASGGAGAGAGNGSPGPVGMGLGIAQALVDAAEELGSTLLVIGIDGMSAHVTGRTRSLGSVSDRVVRSARCNVLVVQRRATFYDASGSEQDGAVADAVGLSEAAGSHSRPSSRRASLADAAGIKAAAGASSGSAGPSSRRSSTSGGLSGR